MSSFVPDGYLPIDEAFARAMKRWFADQISKLEQEVEYDRAKRLEDLPTTDDPVRRAFLQAGAHEGARKAAVPKLEGIKREAEVKFRNLLYAGKLTAHFSEPVSGIEWTIEAKRWATPATDGVIESGLYFPYGKPDGPYAKAPAVKVRVREKKFWEALATSEAPQSELGTSGSVSKSALLGFLMQEANGTRPMKELNKLATAHFRKQGKRVPRTLFRTAAKELPAGKKLGRGEHARTRAARKRAYTAP